MRRIGMGKGGSEQVRKLESKKVRRVDVRLGLSARYSPLINKNLCLQTPSSASSRTPFMDSLLRGNDKARIIYTYLALNLVNHAGLILLLLRAEKSVIASLPLAD